MKNNQSSIRLRSNLALLFFIILFVFIIGLFKQAFFRDYMYNVVISVIFLLSVLTIKDQKNYLFYYAAVIITFNWITEFLDMTILSHVSDLVSFIFFIYVMVFLIMRIARSKTVGPLEFLESINVYFLIGIAGSLLFNIIFNNNSAAFNIGLEHIDSAVLIYYTFTTLTTLGYGDITPVDPFAKSLSILFSVSGQLYLTMIIAVLVGKYLSQKTHNKN